MKFQKYIEDSTKKRRITVSKMSFIPEIRIARINSFKFSGNYFDSQSGEYWIACCDTYVLKKNPCYFGQGGQILLFGEGQKPNSCNVANNGTFTICDYLKNRGEAFFAFDKNGNILIQQEGERGCEDNTISEDGKYAICIIDGFLNFFDLELCSLQWKIESIPLGRSNYLQGSYYLIDTKNKLLFLTPFL